MTAKAASNCQALSNHAQARNAVVHTMTQTDNATLRFKRENTRPNSSIANALTINRTDTGNAAAVRLMPRSWPSASKYSPAVLTIRPEPTNDMTQQPANTNQRREPCEYTDSIPQQ